MWIRRRWGLIVCVALMLGIGIILFLPHWKASRAWHRIQNAMQSRDFSVALQDLPTIQIYWPDDVDVALLSAQLYRRAGMLPEAEQWLIRCRELTLPAEMVRLEANLLAAQRGDLVKVEPHLLPMLRPNRREFLIVAEVLSQEWMRQNRLRESLELLNQWIEHHPDAEAYVRRGWVHEHLVDAESAILDYRRALQLAPDRSAVRLRCAELHLLQSQPDQAKPFLDQLMVNEPLNPAVQLAQSRCLRLLGDYDAALKILDELLAKPQPSAEVFSERGVLALAMNEPARAEMWLRDATRRMPYDRQSHYALVQCLTRLGRMDEADQVSRDLARIDVDRKRIAELVTEVQRKPGDVALRVEIAEIFQRNGMIDDAKRWWATALEYDPNHELAKNGLNALMNKP